MEPNYVDNPKHYVSASGVECIDVVKHLPYALGSAFKYVWRFREKWNPEEDLAKAIWYLREFYDEVSRSAPHVHNTLVVATGAINNAGLLRKHVLWLEEHDPDAADLFQNLEQILSYPIQISDTKVSLNFLIMKTKILKESLAEQHS